MQIYPGSAPLYKIKGQRVGTDGSLVGSAFDVPPSSVQHRNPAIAYLSQSGRYAVAWEDNRSGNYDVYGQLVSPAGTLDGSNYLLSGETQNENFPRLSLDSSNGALAVWQRDNGGTAANDLYGRWLGNDGQPDGEAFAILEADDDQQRPAVAGDGAGSYLLSWQDDRNGNWDIYGSLFEPLQAGFTATPTVGTEPLRVEFTDASTPVGTADQWLWAFGDGYTSTLASPVYTYTQPGVYTVTQWVTDTTTGEADALTQTHYITVALGTITTTITYGYDPLYRLTSATYSSGEVYTYTYDAVGNRLKKGADGEMTTYEYDEANRLMTETVQSLTGTDTIAYTWDDNGNLLDDGERMYTYDYANRLIQVVSGTFTTTFTYNGDGHRMAKSENGVTTNYVVAVLGLSQVLVETTGGSTTRYVYGHDLLAEYDGTSWTYHLNDGLGSVRQLADASGDVTLAQGYTPFGVPMWSEGNGATGYGFTGERWEAYSALLFLRARYYEPGTGRFLNEDPFAGFVLHPTTLHPYSYAANNAVNHVDFAGYQGTSVIQCVWSDPACRRALASAVATALELGVGIISIEVVAPVVIIVAPPAVLLTASYYLAPPPFEPTVQPQPAPTAPPVSAPSPPTSIPEGYAQSEAELNALFGLNPTPEPFPAPRPLADPFIPPCPTDTPEPKWYLYHYTSDAGLTGILATQTIWASIRDPYDPKTDAQWGDGQYFTDLSPQDASQGSAYQLSRALFNSPWRNKRVQRWVRINVAGLLVKRVSPVFSRTYGNRSIYLHPSQTPLSIMDRLEGWGNTPFAR